MTNLTLDEKKALIRMALDARRGEVNKQITSPCGVCRQALFEFGGPELNVIMAKTPDDFIERSMDELLPFGFGPSNVAGNKAVEE